LALLKLDPRRSRSAAIHKGNSPSTTGLDRGGAYGRRDMTRDGSRTEQRPGNYSTSSSESEQGEDERFDREFRDKLIQETNRKSSSENAPKPSYSYSYNSFMLVCVSELHLFSYRQGNIHEGYRSHTFRSH